MACPKECVIIAGLGGIIPTLSRLASTYVTNPSTPMPESGLFFGLLLFFIIGAVLAFAFSESNLKQAFILGVCAPGIITNIVAGVQDAGTNHASLNFRLIPSAVAQEVTAEPKPKDPETLKITKKEQISTLEITTNVTGADNWSTQRIPLSVNFLDSNGNKLNSMRIPAENSSIITKLPPNTKAVEVQTTNYSRVHKLPKKTFSSATITNDIVIKGKNDFLWALGGKRSPSVQNVSSEIGGFQFNKQSVPLTNIIDLKAKDSSGENMGTIKDIKITSDGLVDRIVVEKPTGEIVDTNPNSLVIQKNEVTIRIAE